MSKPNVKSFQKLEFQGWLLQACMVLSLLWILRLIHSFLALLCAKSCAGDTPQTFSVSSCSDQLEETDVSTERWCRSCELAQIYLETYFICLRVILTFALVTKSFLGVCFIWKCRFLAFLEELAALTPPGPHLQTTERSWVVSAFWQNAALGFLSLYDLPLSLLTPFFPPAFFGGLCLWTCSKYYGWRMDRWE